MITVVVPFYKNPHLVDAIGSNLFDRSSELSRCGAELVWVNDSPGERELQLRLLEWKSKLSGRLPIHLIENEANLGFVKSTNAGLRKARRAGHDALLLNSDVLLAPGAITEMCRVAALDPMTGFVNPRSNNATIASLPYSGRLNAVTFAEALKNFEALSPLLPEFQYVPTGVGFCLLIKNVILREFGLLDEAYSLGYNEENDLCLRANRAGYRVVFANRAFAYHESSSSFEEEKRLRLESENREVLNARYPAYGRIVEDYAASPLFQFEQIASALMVRPEEQLRLALDFSHFRADHAGTFEFGLSVLQGLSELTDRKLHLTLLCDRRAAAFHQIERRFPTIEIQPPDTSEVFHAVLKPAQPFHFGEFRRMADRAPYNFIYMLDTIAWDCQEIRGVDTEALWNIAGDVLDGILFISDFSQQQFNLRFPHALQVPQLSSQLSVHERDYLEQFAAWKSRPGAADENISVALPENYVLLVGNHFPHKFVEPTARYLRGKFPDLPLVSLGSSDFKLDGVTGLPSGRLSDSQVGRLYRDAQAVVFPSHYEGFGFPVVHALTRDKVIFARESSLNRQIGARWDGRGCLALFKDLEHLGELLSKMRQNESDFRTGGDPAITRRSASQTFGWREMAGEFVAFIRNVIAQDPLAKKAKHRIEVIRNIERVLKVDEFVRVRNEAEQRALSLAQELEGLRESQLPLHERVAVLESRIDEQERLITWLKSNRDELHREAEQAAKTNETLMSSPAFLIGKGVTGIVKRIPGSRAVYSKLGKQ